MLINDSLKKKSSEFSKEISASADKQPPIRPQINWEP